MSAAKRPKHAPYAPYVPPAPAERRAAFLRKLDKPITTDDEAYEIAIAMDIEGLHSQLDDAKGRALSRGRKPESRNADTTRARAHIRELLARHRKLSPTQLYKKADPDKLRTRGRVMSAKTFGNHVRELRGEK